MMLLKAYHLVCTCKHLALASNDLYFFSFDINKCIPGQENTVASVLI